MKRYSEIIIVAALFAVYLLFFRPSPRTILQSNIVELPPDNSKQLIAQYEQRLKEANGEIAMLKRLTTKVAEPKIVIIRDTVDRSPVFDSLDLDAGTPCDSSLKEAFDFEYPMLVESSPGELTVNTYNKTRNEYRSYSYEVGRRWSLAMNPDGVNQVGVVTSRDWFVFNHIAVGTEMDTGKNVHLAAHIEATLFSRVELQLAGTTGGARLGVYYTF